MEKRLSIQWLATSNFELKHVMFQRLQIMGQFNEIPNENPHLPLK